MTADCASSTTEAELSEQNDRGCRGGFDENGGRGNPKRGFQDNNGAIRWLRTEKVFIIVVGGHCLFEPRPMPA